MRQTEQADKLAYWPIRTVLQLTDAARVNSNDNVTEARWFTQKIMLPGRPLLSRRS